MVHYQARRAIPQRLLFSGLRLARFADGQGISVDRPTRLVGKKGVKKARDKRNPIARVRNNWNEDLDSATLREFARVDAEMIKSKPGIRVLRCCGSRTSSNETSYA